MEKFKDISSHKNKLIYHDENGDKWLVYLDKCVFKFYKFIQGHWGMVFENVPGYLKKTKSRECKEIHEKFIEKMKNDPKYILFNKENAEREKFFKQATWREFE